MSHTRNASDDTVMSPLIENTEFHEFENYNATSKTYDNFRDPIGMPTVNEAINKAAMRLGYATTEKVRVLDAGCGSGTYLHAVRTTHGCQISGLEFNDGMMAKAREKLPDLAKAVKGNEPCLVKGSITAMPFADASFDVVLTTQVLHHLSDGGVPDQAFENVAAACKEVFRVLRPGGAWVVQTSTPQQVKNGFWWAPIIPKAVEIGASRFPPLATLEALSRAAGFEDVASTVPDKPLVSPDKYLKIDGPFDKTFRDADST